jgi:glycyl-tRNA synthetase beta chain
VLRILIEHDLAIDLAALLADTCDGFTGIALSPTVAADVFAFMLDRLRSYLRERGYAPDVIEAVVTQDPRRIDSVLPRLDAVRAFGTLPESAALAAANKRIVNILKKSGQAGAVDAARLVEPEERALFDQLALLEPEVEAQLHEARFDDSLRSLAGIRDRVDAFFDKVMVNAEDAALRANRLGLLTRLNTLMNRVADISKLAQ